MTLFPNNPNYSLSYKYSNLIFNFTLQTTFENGNLKLTTHRIVWDDLDQQVSIKLI